MYCPVRLSQTKTQPYWKEEIPVVPIKPMIPYGTIWRQDGYLSRAGEKVDYIIRLDIYLLWVRYRGDPRFTSRWQSIILNRRWRLGQGDVWTGCCPFCSSSIQEFRVFERTLRCNRCLPLTSRWRYQGEFSYKLRKEIRAGHLSEVAKALRGPPQEVFRAMLAMELTGLAPIRFSSVKTQPPWELKKRRGKRG